MAQIWWLIVTGLSPTFLIFYLFSLLQLEKVLQPGDVPDVYTKEEKSINREKAASLAKQYCDKLGAYRMPFAWTAIQLMNMVNGANSLDKDSTLGSDNSSTGSSGSLGKQIQVQCTQCGTSTGILISDIHTFWFFAFMAFMRALCIEIWGKPRPPCNKETVRPIDEEIHMDLKTKLGTSHYITKTWYLNNICDVSQGTATKWVHYQLCLLRLLCVGRIATNGRLGWNLKDCSM